MATEKRRPRAGTTRVRWKAIAIASRCLLRRPDPVLLLRQSMAALLSTVLVVQPVLVHAQVAPDLGAPIGNQPGVGAAPNGVPLVDIVTPNSTGLSHNKYSDFNVGTPGLILNNSNRDTGTSLLGGVTPGNVNLKNSGPATIILNEVTSGRRSALEGAIEVFGGRADVIVANPNGITCSGCGFINTPRATLTTGTPDIDGAGKLSGFTVQGGDVTFGSKGGNFAQGAGAVDLFDIVSRRIQIDGPVAGKQLRLSAGRQKTDYASGGTTAIAGPDDAPEFAIDGTAFGAMQADRIKIIVTDKGAGVRMRTDMAANAGELTLSADGKISLGNVSGRDGVQIQSKSQRAEAKKITSKKQVVVKADQGLTLESVAADADVVLDAGSGLLSVAADIAGLGNVTLTSTGAIAVNKVTAAQNADLHAGQGIRGETLIADGGVRLLTGAGDVAFAGAISAGGGDLTLTATSGDIQAGSLLSFNNMSLTAGRDIRIGEAILAGGALVADAASIRAGSAASGVDFDATQAADGTVKLKAGQGTSGDMRLSSQAGTIEIATLLSSGALDVTADAFRAQSVISQDAVTINADTSVSGQLLSGSDITVTGPSIAIDRAAAGISLAALYDHNTIIPGQRGSLTLSATVGNVLGRQFLSAGNMAVTSGGDVTASLHSHGDIDVRAGGTITLDEQSLAGGRASLDARELKLGTLVTGVDFAATDSSGGALILKSGPVGAMLLTARGGSIVADRLVSGGDLVAHAVRDIIYGGLNSFRNADLSSEQGTISVDQETVAKGDLTLALRHLDLSGGRSKLATAGTLTVHASDADFSGSVLTFGGVELDLSGVANMADTILRAVTADGGTGNIAITAQSITTTPATAILAGNDLVLVLASLVNSAQLAASNNLTLNIADIFTNTQNGLVYAGKDAHLNVAGDLINDQGAIITGNDLTIAANASGDRNQSVTNISGMIRAGRDVTITTAQLTNKRLYIPTLMTIERDPTTVATFVLNPDVADKPFMHLYQGANDDGPSDYLFPNLPRQQWEDYSDQLWSGATLEDGTSYHAWTWVSGKGPTGSEAIRDWIAARVPRDADGNIILDKDNPSKYFIVNRQGKPADTSTIYEWDNSARIDQIIYEDVLVGDAAPEALIRAGGNLTIDATQLNNSYSTIEADGNAALRGETLTNEGFVATRKTLLECHAQGACEAYDADGNRDPSKDMANGTTVLVRTEATGLLSGNIQSAGHLDISGFATVINRAAENTIAGDVELATPVRTDDPTSVLAGMTAAGALYTPNAALGAQLNGVELIAALANSAPKPQSGGFGGTIPGQVFLYETRAEFLDVGRFYGSAYFIDRIGYKPEREVPFLGDAYFENQLVDQQLRDLVGQGLGKGSFIPGSDVTEQMKVLLDRGADYAAANGLTIGEMLSPELIAGLTESLVWYEKQTVNGIEVLVPKVYIASTDKAVLTASGALISGESVDMNVASVDNSGTIAAKTDLKLAATSISATGGTFKAGSDVSLAATGDLTLKAQTLTVGGQTVVNPDAMVASGGSATLRAGETVRLQGAGVEAAGDVVVAGHAVVLDAEKVENGGSQNATGARIKAGGDIGISADTDVTIIGSSAKADGALGITAENGSVNVVSTDVTRTTSDGYSKTVATTQQQSQLSSGGDASIRAKKDVLISGSSLDSGGDASIKAGGDVSITTAENNSDITFGKNSGTTTTHTGSEITAKGNIAISAGEDGSGSLNVIGSRIAADETVDLKAADNVTIAEARDSGSYEFHAKSGKNANTDATLETETARGSSVSGKTGVNVTSGKDTIVSASKIDAGDDGHKADLTIDAGGNLIVSSGKNTVEDQTRSDKKGFLSKSKWNSEVYDETTVASELGASGNVTLNAGKEVAIAGSKVTAGDDIAIEGDSVSIIGAQERHDSATTKKTSGIGAGSGDGFYSIWGKKQKDKTENIVANIGSELNAGNDVSITARKGDVNIVGSQVEAGNDIALEAARDVNILPGQESYQSEEKEKRSGFGIQLKSGEGSASIGIGYGSSKDKVTEGAETNAVSTLKAGHDVVITAGRDANLQAAKVEAENDVAITAERDVNLLAAEDKTNYEHMHEELFAGVTAQVSTGVVGAAKSIGKAAEKVSNVSDKYSAANAAFAGLKAIDGANNLASMVVPDDKGNFGNIASASVGIGFEYSKSKQEAETSTPVVTEIRAGNNVSIEAKSGDINSHGSQIAAGYDADGMPSDGDGDISLKAGNDINLLSAEATEKTSASSKSAGASVGYSAGLGLGGVTGGWTGEFHGGKSDSESTLTSQVNTHVNGTGDITIKSGRDTNLKGAVVTGDTITADVGRDLNIVSVPDVGETSNESSSVGVSGSLTGGTPKVTGVSPGYGTGSGETNWISEQSGLVSKGKMDVTVEGNTHLDAGKIISDDGDLTLDTGTLTHENFSGKKQYEGFDIQASIDLTGTDASGNKQQRPDQTSQPKTTAEGSYQLDDTRQEVRATVGPGQIIIRDKEKQAELEATGQTEELAALNRDPDQAYEITKDKHVEIDYYLSDTSLNAVGSAIGKAMEPGGFVDRYLLGKELTPQERENIREGLSAIENGGTFGGCGQRQGFNRFSPFEWIVSSAYAYETSCFIARADGSHIELGISTYEKCQDAIKAYLNSLSFDERTRVIQEAGFATTSGAIPSDLLIWHVNELIRLVVTDLDNGQRGQYSEFYNSGVFAGKVSGIAKSAELTAVWGDPALSFYEKIEKLNALGLDVMGIMAAATVGGIGNRGTGAIYKTNKEARIAADELGFVKINDTTHGGQPIYKSGNLYITRDLDGHNGGAWKMAGSVKDLGSKSTRMGTYDVKLNRVGD